MSGDSIVENMVICKETVTKPLRVSDLKMLGALIVGNMVICNKIMNKTSLRIVFFLNINKKDGLDFQKCASIAFGPMSAYPKEIFKVISYYQKMALGI